MEAPYSQGIHYPSPNLYTNGPAILLCLHFLPARLSRFPPLATKQVTSAVCHRQRSFKVAGALRVDRPITITSTATFELEDLVRRAGWKDKLYRNRLRWGKERGVDDMYEVTPLALIWLSLL